MALHALSDEALETRIGLVGNHLHDGRSGAATTHADMKPLLDEKSRRALAADPSLKAKRLRNEAAAAWARHERALELHLDFAGRVAPRIEQGAHELAAQFERQSDTYLRAANKADAEYIRLILEAAVEEARLADAQALAGIVGPFQERGVG